MATDSPFSEAEIKEILRNAYNLSGQIKPLPGEIDYNFKVETDDGKVYVLKLASPERDEQQLAFENATMLFLQQKDFTFNIPYPVPLSNRDDHTGSIMSNSNKQYAFRLLTWIEGTVWADFQPHSQKLLNQLGTSVGALAEALQELDDTGGHRYLKWNISEGLWINEHLPLFDESDMSLMKPWIARFNFEVVPVLGELRSQICYNDANDYNILLASDQPGRERIVGFIDFGDAVHTAMINELAVACMYAIAGKRDPLVAAMQVVKGFNQVIPLWEDEIKILSTLIAMRVLISLTVARINAVRHPENDYLQISTSNNWKLLRLWCSIPVTWMEAGFRSVCGMEPFPQNQLFTQKANLVGRFADILGYSLTELNCKVMDLSVESTELGNNEEFENINSFCDRIRSMMGNSPVGIGRYLEPRPLYTTDLYLEERNEGPEWRSVHLGLDLFVEAGHPVFAPLEGKILHVENHQIPLDYGPTLILEHNLDGQVFYTLYGHLGKSILTEWKAGDLVKAGDQLAIIGKRNENGSWPPHLHFQIILDLLGHKGNFPGVGNPNDIPVWRMFCPDPNLLIRAPFTLNFKPDIRAGDIFNRRKKILGKNLSLSYKDPLHIVRGSGPYLYDRYGRKYLDMVNNVAHVGHEHPKVVDAAIRQMSVLNTNTRYIHKNVVRFAEQLIQTMPGNLDVVFLCNSGSEANELALRMLTTVTGRSHIIPVQHGYHGNTGACIQVSSYKFDGPGGKGRSPHIHLVPCPDVYRGMYTKESGDSGKKYARHVSKALREIETKGGKLAGFISETILSCGGQIVPPTGYFKEVYRLVRKAGGLCIADEVQTGVGRVGSHFWAFEMQGVVPDIITIGKPIGNGHPLGVLVTTREIADAFDNGMEYFNTFGGNPVSSAIGLAVLKVVEEEKLQRQAQKTGTYLLQELGALKSDFPIIGDIRGEGMFLGFELVKDPIRKIAAPAAASHLVNRMVQQGILLSTDGPDYNVIKIKPPLVFDKGHADQFLERLEKILKENVFQL